jgi:hypothetical protein
MYCMRIDLYKFYNCIATASRLQHYIWIENWRHHRLTPISAVVLTQSTIDHTTTDNTRFRFLPLLSSRYSSRYCSRCSLPRKAAAAGILNVVRIMCLPGAMFRTCNRKHSENIQGRFNERSGSTKEPFREHGDGGNIQQTVFGVDRLLSGRGLQRDQHNNTVS